MKPITSWMLVMALAGAATPVFADHDEHGYDRHEHRGHKGGEYKEVYWDGNCKVERSWKKNGKYKEKRLCQAPHARGPYPSPVYQEPGVVVQPPALVIQPPPIVIK